MGRMNKWIAAATLALLAAGSAVAQAQACDPAAVACLAGAPGDVSFLDLVRQGSAAVEDVAPPRDSLAQPAAYVPEAAPAPSTANMAPAGVGALDSAMGTQLTNERVPAWLALPKSLAAPDSSVAWLFALGFLGFVILRRVRSARSY